MDESKLLRNGDFCTVVGDDLDELDEGSTIYIVGHRALPFDKEDPYLQRIYFSITKVVDDHIDFSDGKFMMVDAKRLQKVDKDEQDRLHKILVEDYGDGDGQP